MLDQCELERYEDRIGEGEINKLKWMCTSDSKRLLRLFVPERCVKESRQNCRVLLSDRRLCLALLRPLLSLGKYSENTLYRRVHSSCVAGWLISYVVPFSYFLRRRMRHQCFKLDDNCHATRGLWGNMITVSFFLRRFAIGSRFCACMLSMNS